MKILLAIIVLLAAAIIIFINTPQFGRMPRGSRLQRIKQSPNYANGAFKNQIPTQNITEKGGILGALASFIFTSPKHLNPAAPLPTVKTNLHELPADTNVVVWLGHSSLYMQLAGLRFLMDPVLLSAAPVSFLNKPFKGTDIYKPDDMPPIDYLVITHDHWDHLDYETVRRLKNRVGHVICPLGVGEHFERWGYAPEKITELDWNQQVPLAGGITFTALPARHFSGRGLKQNPTLWFSFMLQGPFGNIYHSGDSGFGPHFEAIKKQFGHIDMALLENGQYNQGWAHIHMLPQDLLHAADILKPARMLTIHNGKFALGRHPWYEPLEKVWRAAAAHNINLATPMIGQPVLLSQQHEHFKPWWQLAIQQENK